MSITILFFTGVNLSCRDIRDQQLVLLASKKNYSNSVISMEAPFPIR